MYPRIFVILCILSWQETSNLVLFHTAVEQKDPFTNMLRYSTHCESSREAH